MEANRAENPVSQARIAASTFLFIIPFCVLSALIGRIPHSVLSIAFTLTMGFIITPIIAAPIEWAVHRYILHSNQSFLRRFYLIHMAHHSVFFPPGRYVTAGPAQRIAILGQDLRVPQTSRWGNCVTYLAHVVFYLFVAAALVWVPAWLLSRNVGFLAGLILGSAVLSNLFIIVHDSMHRPGCHKSIEGRRWYLILDRHHHIHHADTRVNFNSLLPFADWLFGTLSEDITDEGFGCFRSPPPEGSAAGDDHVNRASGS